MRRRIGATVVIGGSHVQGTRSQVLYCSPAVQPYTRGLIVISGSVASGLHRCVHTTLRLGRTPCYYRAARFHRFGASQWQHREQISPRREHSVHPTGQPTAMDDGVCIDFYYNPSSSHDGKLDSRWPPAHCGTSIPPSRTGQTVT